MGLDQYAFTSDLGLEELQAIEGEKPLEEIAYWRKHNRLQGWMAQRWQDAGNEDVDEFNCELLPLTAEDIDALEEVINNRDLPHTTGFFFGSDSYEGYEQWYKADDLAFIEKAREALAVGKKVYYYCWW